MWKIKQKICPKIDVNVSVAKLDEKGNLVSNKTDLKKLYVNVYKHRLRHRDIKEGYEKLKRGIYENTIIAFQTIILFEKNTSK